MTTLLDWVALNRQSLPGLVAEGEIPPSATRAAHPAADGSDIFVGMSHDSASGPLIVVLNSRDAREILAWLATYSPASFPIAQSIRTMTTDEFAPGLLSTVDSPAAWDSVGYWPSIILGELMGQSEQPTNIDSVALSRGNACFSFAQARAAGLHGATSSPATDCAKRLRILETDRVFSRRSISIEDLAPIWAWTRNPPPDSSMQRELSRLVEDTVNGRLSEQVSPNRLSQTAGFDARSLGSGTIEDRVRAYQRFAQFMPSVRDPDVARSSAMLLAAAAICVGNGTSHISLLDDFGKKAPAAYAWFGLFAAMTGPRGWDPGWNRAINAVGRALRSRFEITDPPGFDLSWIEYDFVREVPKPAEFLRHVPKLFAKSLSVEVVPGATCQVRLADEPGSVRPAPLRTDEVRDRPETKPGALSAQLTTRLYEAERVLAHGQALLRNAIMAGDSRPPNQVRMFEDEPEAKRRRRSEKKGKKNPTST